MAKPQIQLTTADHKLAATLAADYASNYALFQGMLTQLNTAIQESPALMKHIHSTKFRIKDKKHLEDKLLRKMIIAKEQKKNFSITKNNLFSKIDDLVGYRILHLHTQQIDDINHELRKVLDQRFFTIVEGPLARTWDDENRNYFKNIGIKTQKSPTMYTSVHYIIKMNNRLKGRCEIQVRTLAEELWGEVDHAMNYPHPSKSRACQEQIKVLARITSSCSRLVDSIFNTTRSH